MVKALDETSKRPFDEAAMIAALGEAWEDINIDNVGGNNRRRLRSRRWTP